MKTQNRTFIVSGGASGLGKACVEDLLRGVRSNVAILDLSSDGEALVAALGPSARFFSCDVVDTQSVAQAVDAAARWARETARPLGGVVSAAGISLPATILDRNGAAFALDDFDLVLGVNLRGTVDLVRQSFENPMLNGTVLRLDGGSRPSKT